MLLDDFFPCAELALNGISYNEVAPCAAGWGGGCGGEVITEQESLQDWLPSWEPSGALECFVGAPRLPLFCLHGQKEPEAEQGGILSSPSPSCQFPGYLN